MIKALLWRVRGHSLEEKKEGLICIKSEKETALCISKKELFWGIRNKKTLCLPPPPPPRLECRLFCLSKYNPNKHKSDTSNLSKHPYTCSQMNRTRHGTDDQIRSRARHIYVISSYLIRLTQTIPGQLFSGWFYIHSNCTQIIFRWSVHFNRACTHLQMGAINIFFSIPLFYAMYTSFICCRLLGCGTNPDGRLRHHITGLNKSEKSLRVIALHVSYLLSISIATWMQGF